MDDRPIPGHPSIIETASTRSGGDFYNAMAVAHYVMPDLTASLRQFMDLAYMFAGWFGCTLEVFLRSDFGERHLNWMRLYMAYTLLMTLAMFATFFGAVNPPFVAFVAAFVIASLWHAIGIQRRNWRKVLWHSRYGGIPLLAAPFKLLGIRPPTWLVFCVLEPGLGLLIAGLIGSASPLLSLWLVLASFGLGLRSLITEMNMRARTLDIIDAKLEATFLDDSAAGADVRQTAGVVAVHLPAFEKVSRGQAATGGAWADA